MGSKSFGLDVIGDKAKFLFENVLSFPLLLGSVIHQVYLNISAVDDGSSAAQKSELLQSVDSSTGILRTLFLKNRWMLKKTGVGIAVI